MVLTEEEIFGPREKRRARRSWPESAAIEALGHLSVGDHLVHAEHGIGIYRGLIELTLRGVAGEFLRIEYAEGDRHSEASFGLATLRRDHATARRDGAVEFRYTAKAGVPRTMTIHDEQTHRLVNSLKRRRGGGEGSV